MCSSWCFYVVIGAAACGRFGFETDLDPPQDGAPQDISEMPCSAMTKGALGQWRAPSLANQGACAGWDAISHGLVPVMDCAPFGSCWAFRSTDQSGDPDFLDVPTSAGDLVLDTITLQAVVRQTGFNDYFESDRVIVATRPQNGALPELGNAQIYVHGNRATYGIVRVGPDFVQGSDWEVCVFGILTTNELHQLTLTYDGSNLACYVDGTQQSISPLTRRMSGPIQTITIGRSYPGDVVAARVFARALSTTEIAATWF
jgi:hypothetical protein